MGGAGRQVGGWEQVQEKVGRNRGVLEKEQFGAGVEKEQGMVVWLAQATSLLCFKKLLPLQRTCCHHGVYCKEKGTWEKGVGELDRNWHKGWFTGIRG